MTFICLWLKQPKEVAVITWKIKKHEYIEIKDNEIRSS